MAVMSVSEARQELPSAVEASQREAVLLERHGERVAVLISWDRYCELMDALEDLEDLRAVEEARSAGDLDTPGIPWDEVKAELGWT